MGVDKSALRREVKGLLRAWKQLKKQQKRERRQVQRDIKQRRRQEKRERHQAKRQMKHAARETKRQQHRGHPGPFGMPHMPPMPPMPHMPHMPPVHSPMPMPMPMPGTYGQPPHGDTHPRSAPPTTEFANPLFNLWGGGGHNTNNTNQTPGAWPSDNNHNHTPNDEGIASTAPPPAYSPSQAKYKAAWDMEAKVAEKEAELLKLHERIAEGYSAASGGGGGGQGETGKEGPSKLETEALAVGREVEELARAMERLRTEADEEFARELAEEEERGFRG
jgi:hypothetical protein